MRAGSCHDGALSPTCDAVGKSSAARTRGREIFWYTRPL